VIYEDPDGNNGNWSHNLALAFIDAELDPKEFVRVNRELLGFKKLNKEALEQKRKKKEAEDREFKIKQKRELAKANVSKRIMTEKC